MPNQQEKVKKSVIHKTDETNQAQGASKGDVLKQARLAKGLSLELVHDATKIPMDALRAIEEGYTVRTLSAFYYKGFLKIYAQYLEIELAEVIEDYRIEALPKNIDSSTDEFSAAKWFNKIFTRERKQQLVILIGIFLVLFMLFKIIGFFNQLRSKANQRKSTKVVKVKQNENRGGAEVNQVSATVEKEEKKKNAPKPTTAPVVVAKPVQPAVPPPVEILKDVTLTVRARKNSWLRVKSDEEIVFQSTLREGAVETWMADEKLEISGRNINELEFELNGKMIGTLGRKDRKAKKVIITKDGLNVTK